MNTMVQSDSMVKPKADAIRQVAKTIQSVVTSHPFFHWKWIVVDVMLIGVWILH